MSLANYYIWEVEIKLSVYPCTFQFRYLLFSLTYYTGFQITTYIIGHLAIFVSLLGLMTTVFVHSGFIPLVIYTRKNKYIQYQQRAANGNGYA